MAEKVGASPCLASSHGVMINAEVYRPIFPSYPLVNDHIAGWNIPIFNRVHTSTQSGVPHFPASYVRNYRSVTLNKQVQQIISLPLKKNATQFSYLHVKPFNNKTSSMAWRSSLYGSKQTNHSLSSSHDPWMVYIHLHLPLKSTIRVGK